MDLPKEIADWVQEMRSLLNPADVRVISGDPEEQEFFLSELENQNIAIPLNPLKRPNSYLFRSDPRDVARVEEKTFICSKTKEEAGPTNHWEDPTEMKERLKTLFRGCMEGRTLYVIPFLMGSKLGVQLTDSLYVVVHMYLMTKSGRRALEHFNGDFVPCIHSVGVPLKQGVEDSRWPCNPEKLVIAHFPETREVWSFGSGYGGNALLGKKCLALRLASVMGRDEGWLAEHMLIMALINPEGRKKYFVAAFPSACGKTNMAMLTPNLPGWRVETVGDDIAWLRFKEDGKLYAINPEAGFFGVAPGTSFQSNPVAMQTIAKDTLFTNVALTDDQDVYWQGMTEEKPAHLIDWLGKDWTLNSSQVPAQPNARFTVSAKECPIIDPRWEDPEGVPISAIIFGGRRSKTIPLVYEAYDWKHGVFLGTSVSSETTAAAVGDVGALRHDPFAMLPFCGYNMADYFGHWLEMGKRSKLENLPKFFAVNWFRKDEKGFMWPGFGENARVLKWIFERCDQEKEALNSPIGYLPKLEDLGNPDPRLFQIDREGWLKEVEDLKEYFSIFQNRMPQGILDELKSLENRLKQ